MEEKIGQHGTCGPALSPPLVPSRDSSHMASISRPSIPASIFWIFLELKIFPTLLRKIGIPSSSSSHQYHSQTQTLKISTHTHSHYQASPHM